jgi:hypothetical protein
VRVCQVLELPSPKRRESVKQDELARLAELQLAAWMASERATRYALWIHHRIETGAPVEDGRLVFDSFARMARAKCGMNR